MENPLEIPKPDDPIQAIHDHARDLAYLAVNKAISPRIEVWDGEWLDNPYKNSRTDRLYPLMRYTFASKWVDWKNSTTEMLELLVSYGYLTTQRENYPIEDREIASMSAAMGEPTYHTIVAYSLTPKAFALLEKPIKPPRIFISYKRTESAAFALLIEARLRLLGIDTVFIDKNILAGEQWHGELEERIKGCPVFIGLIGPKTLDSEMVQKEIAWAVEADSRIITIWHNGCTMSDDTLKTLRSRQAITVTAEGAKEYETGISELLNSLGYRTY